MTVVKYKANMANPKQSINAQFKFQISDQRNKNESKNNLLFHFANSPMNQTILMQLAILFIGSKKERKKKLKTLLGTNKILT